MRSSRGFTLIELMITVVILSFLVGIAIPSFRELIDRNTVTTEANNILSSILLARSEAIKRERPVMFTTNPALTSWQVVAETAPGVFGNVLLQHDRDPNSSATITAAGTVATITFNSRGRATLNPNFDFFNITVDRPPNYKHASCIFFTTNGRPSIVKYTDSATDVCI